MSSAQENSAREKFRNIRQTSAFILSKSSFLDQDFYVIIMLLAEETITYATKEHADQDSTDTLIP